MESFIIAFISLLILLPVLYFLPLGFSVKGKVFIVVGSFLTGLFGLVASNGFSAMADRTYFIIVCDCNRLSVK